MRYWAVAWQRELARGASADGRSMRDVRCAGVWDGWCAGGPAACALNQLAPARAVDDAARHCAGVLAVLEDAATVDPDIADAGRELVWIGER